MANKRLQRLISVVLSLVLMLCIVPVASAQEDYAASVNGVGYTTVAEAVSKANGGVVKLLKDSQEQVTANGDLYLDLNGHTLAGLNMASGMLYGMDSTTDDYDCSNGYGKIKSLTGSYAPNYKTEITGTYRRYLAVNENGAVSFHRIYLGLVYATMRPAAKGVGYKAIFAADSVAKSQLDETEAFGYTLRLEGGESLSVWKPVSKFVSLKHVTLLLQNFDAAAHGQTNVHASVQLKLKSGTVISSASYSTTLKTVMETVNDTYTTYTQEQISLLADWIKEVPVMMDWRTENIVPREITGPAFMVENAVAEAGKQVQVKIKVVNNPGVTSIRLNVAYNDAVLKLKSLTYNSAIGGTGIQLPSNHTSSPATVYWSDNFKDVTGDWDLVTLTFDVAQDAAAGDYGITVTYNPDDVYNANEDNVAFNVVNGKITVEGKAETPIVGPTFVVESVTAKAGNQIQMKIKVVNNPGVTSVRLNVAYNDAVLKLKSLTYNSAIGGTGIQLPSNHTSSPATVYWSDNFKDVTGDWDLVTLTFDVAQDAAAGDYGVTVTYNPDDVYDANEDNVTFNIVNGTITVS